MHYEIYEEHVVFHEVNEIENPFISSLFREWVDNDCAIQQKEDVLVTWTEILKLDRNSLNILGFPHFYNGAIHLGSDQLLSETEFILQCRFLSFYPGGNILQAQLIGAIVIIDDIQYLLTENQYAALLILKNFNAKSNKSLGINLLAINNIKKVCTFNDNIFLDEYLENENILVPKDIKLEAKYEGGQLKLIPRLAISEGEITDDRFAKSFDKKAEVKDLYSITDDDGSRIRIIPTESVKTDLEEVKLKQIITGDDQVQAFIDNPERFIEGQHVDLSFFYSDRVKEIGFYRPKYTTFISPYKSKWIPGFTIKDKINGDSSIAITDNKSLENFSQKIEEAESKGNDTIEINGKNISIPYAKEFRAIATKQLEQQDRPIDRNLKEKAPKKILIIKDNQEFIEYEEPLPNVDDFKHIFHPIINLRNEIVLKRHQKEGIAWLQNLYLQDAKGCLLADDMGLGKTIQILYFIEWLAQYKSSDKPVLIVAPVSLLKNWEKEYEKFFKSHSYILFKFYGENARRYYKGFDESFNQEDAARLQKKQIILTNYETVRAYQACLGLVNFSVQILDEAQRIKTNGTQITQVCKALKSSFKIAMTGTPVENTLMDIWSIMDYCLPNKELLGSEKEFHKKYHLKIASADPELQKLITEELRTEIGVFLKRRLKKDVADELPQKHNGSDSHRLVEMPGYQFNLYKDEIKKAQSDKNMSKNMLVIINNFKCISDHPDYINGIDYTLPIQILISRSAKLVETIKILHEIQDRNEKAIIFAERREIQRLLAVSVLSIFGIEASIINGDTPTDDEKSNRLLISRQVQIDMFEAKSGFNVIIMSPLAAGVGLNVVGANHVIHYSRHWNPAKENQATDRAYRIGQTKDVYVYYPTAIFPQEYREQNGIHRSFDETLDVLLQRKQYLAENALFPTDQAEIIPGDLWNNIIG